jgi:hypothetical protein
MAPIEYSESFIVEQECIKAAWENGYHVLEASDAGWYLFSSTTAQGRIALAGAGTHGPWFLALEHPGVIAELKVGRYEENGPLSARYGFASLDELYRVLNRVYALAVSLPNVPLVKFLEQTRNLPKTTEAERLVIQRIGQDIFRESLLQYSGGRCEVTGISDAALLRASHIVPWAKCDDDTQRLDVHNGLLLSALWDAAFDQGLVTFEDDGSVRYAAQLSAEARALLGTPQRLRLNDGRRRNLAWHRECVFGRKPGR